MEKQLALNLCASSIFENVPYEIRDSTVSKTLRTRYTGFGAGFETSSEFFAGLRRSVTSTECDVCTTKDQISCDPNVNAIWHTDLLNGTIEASAFWRGSSSTW